MYKYLCCILLLVCFSARAEHFCAAGEVWIEMNCGLCDEDETCLEGGCCPNDMVSGYKDVCCDYITFEGECHYHGGACPDGMIWDSSTQKCIVECDIGEWTGTRCCPVQN